jgi:LacI family transcriptional regulator
MAQVRSATLLISTSPAAWRPEKASNLSGVIVIPQEVTTEEINVIKDRNIPFLILSGSDLAGPHVQLGQREAARKMTELMLELGHRRFALLTGFDSATDPPKRRGIHEALRAAGIEPSQVPEFSSHDQEGDIFKAVKEVLALRPRPTAVIAFDDSLGSILSFHARRNEGLGVPSDLSIVSFHHWPYLDCIEPALTTVQFEFFKAGQQAAETLNHAFLTGQAAKELVFRPTYYPGQTIGPVPR